jgi:hypothetical protein
MSATFLLENLEFGGSSSARSMSMLATGCPDAKTEPAEGQNGYCVIGNPELTAKLQV